MPIDISDPIFHDETAAWKYFEAIRWPGGPVCPHCGRVNEADPIAGKSARRGLYRCRAAECRKQFTATIGTVFERSHIPMHKWLLATHLLCSSKKGMSANQLFRNLGLGSYRTAWFMAHRIREAMVPGSAPRQGPPDSGKVLEMEEGRVRRNAKNPAYDGPTPKKVIATLVEHEGRARSLRAPTVTGKSVKEILAKHASKESVLTTDDHTVSPEVGEESAIDLSVDRSTKESVRPSDCEHTETLENYSNILKRAITGVYHGVSEAHLHRYLAEFGFRHNNRSKLGVGDAERTARALRGVEHKRLVYAKRRSEQR